MRSQSKKYDVIIIGGGPAGSSLGAYLSMAGISNLLIESANHPRPHVGESLVPSTTRVFDEIGFLETMESAGFVKKRGAAWHPQRQGNIQSILFKDFPLEGVNQDYTYHVERSRFDHLLLKHAEGLGTKVIQGVHVKEVLFENEHACGVKLDVGGESVDISAPIVVDATGRNTLMGKQLRCMQKDPLFDQYVVHGWFEGIDRGAPETAEHIHIHFLPVERGWVWQIPLDEKTTSIGVVAEKRVFKQSGKDHAGWFKELSQAAPDIANALRGARQVKDFEVEADYSYCMDSFCGNGYLLVGDAARFVDPIFSSGISVALYSAKFASEAIQDALKKQDFSRAVFEPYELRLKKGTSIWYEFITLYYKLLPLFTYFIQNEEYRREVLALLSGDVYDRDSAPVLDAMREYIQIVESSDSHLLKDALDGKIPIEDLVAAHRKSA